MTKEAKQTLEDMVEMALAHNYAMNRYFCCVERAGAYMTPDPKCPSCHPLEAIIIGQAVNDYVNVEIATALDVQLQWIDGFIDGYGGNKMDVRYEKLGAGHPDYFAYKDGYKEGVAFQGTVENMENYNRPWPSHEDEPF